MHFICHIQYPTINRNFNPKLDAIHLPHTISKEYLPHIISAFDFLHCFNINVGNGEGSTRLCNHTKTVININMETKTNTKRKPILNKTEEKD